MSGAHADAHADSLPAKLQQATGESVYECYQCGKCTAGCPLAAEMDYAPNQVLRLLQLGIPELEEEVLSSLAIWLCLTCEQCATRCPQEVELPRIMDWLRQQAQACGTVHPGAKDILAFHEAFLNQVKKHGRLYEVGLVSQYKLKTGHLLQDVLLAPKMLARGKLGLLPKGNEGKEAVGRIFERVKSSK
jgi:heterodisulfide reductase subunit C2